MSTLMRRNNFFDDFFTKDLFDFGNPQLANVGRTLPSVNVKEIEKAFEIEFAAPGMKKEDFQISLDRNVLTVSSETKTESEEKNEEGKYTRREFNYQSFKRSFTLPETVEQDKIEAEYTDGILKIAIPKKDVTVQTSKMIEVK